jgi:hypothetical protein
VSERILDRGRPARFMARTAPGVHGHALALPSCLTLKRCAESQFGIETCGTSPCLSAPARAGSAERHSS